VEGTNMTDEPAPAPTDSAQDDGCQVDWAWLAGREIVAAASDLDSLVLTFGDGETLKVKAAIWQGKAFLAFDPWRAGGPSQTK
jgi:hypothetical protein